MIDSYYSYFVIFYLSLCSIFIATIIGLMKYRSLSLPFQIIVIGLIITAISETCSCILVYNHKYHERYTLYHFYDIVESFFTTVYFIYIIKPRSSRLCVAISAVFWPAIGIFNIFIFQPLGTMNTNMLMTESFVFITLSLYFIYQTIKSNEIINMFKYPYFLMTLTILVLWSSSFFFWAFVHFLFEKGWKYSSLSTYVQTGIEIIVYLCMAVVLLRDNSKVTKVK
jgi:hypothetical protein